jgi:3-methylcrotonyl-CoA carboxylase alpha subunit
VQRRHQKVLEEAPAPGMTPERRAAMGKAAVDAALAVNYVGAGTVEFIVDQEGAFYFMEMNTRLQVEHPVTEMITGQDLVEWQIRVASGEPLPVAQDALSIRGHAIEARIYAEDPARKFLPSTGKLAHLQFADPSDDIRVDTGVREGDEISPFYDPMIAKLITYGEDRTVALARLGRALADTQIVGVRNNVSFLGALLRTPSFSNADLDTGLIEREDATLFSPLSDTQRRQAVMVAVAAELHAEHAAMTHADPGNPWFAADAWRINHAASRSISLDIAGEPVTVQVDYLASGYRMHDGTDGGECVARVASTDAGAGRLSVSLNGRQLNVLVVAHGQERHLFFADASHVVTMHERLASSDIEDDAAGNLAAPMPGKLIQLVAAVGQTVRKGDSLLVMEAMKMEHTIAAPADGSVTGFRFAVGDQVNEGQTLVDFEVASE